MSHARYVTQDFCALTKQLHLVQLFYEKEEKRPMPLPVNRVSSGQMPDLNMYRVHHAIEWYVYQVFCVSNGEAQRTQNKSN
jgi:hypothetical protein